MQKMEIVRPPADVARYTMVFHKRDAGNKVNKDRLGRPSPGWEHRWGLGWSLRRFLLFSGWSCWCKHPKCGERMDSTAALIRLCQWRENLFMWMLLWTLVSHRVETSDWETLLPPNVFYMFYMIKGKMCHVCKKLLLTIQNADCW